MMVSFKHQEENIKETLQKMPDIVPSTNKEELYQRISTQRNLQPKKKSKRLILIPAFSTIFVALLVFVLVIDNGQYTVQDENSADKASNESSTLNESMSKDQGNQLRSIAEGTDSNLIIQDINNHEKIFFGEVTDERIDYVIPVSIVLPDDNPKSFYDNQIKMVENTLSKMFHSIHFRTETFSNGNESIEKAGYKIYKGTDNNSEFLIPITTEENTELEDALIEMKSVETESYVIPSIPSNVMFSVKEFENVVQLTVQDNVSLEDNKQYKNMLEAILMTAKSYGYKAVKFNNTTIEKIGPYHLNGSIQVPVAVNPIDSIR